MGTKVVLEIEADLNSEQFSYANEANIIAYYLSQLDIKYPYCVDIGAADGIAMSNTFSLFKSGWQGLAVEAHAERFAKLAVVYYAMQFSEVNLCRAIVTPENIVDLLKATQIPREFGCLNLDIDGYDYFVLEKVLQQYRPALVCTEINETIPPPLKFTVQYSPTYEGPQGSFYGQSISQLFTLCEQYNYSLVELEYNNAFLIPNEISPKLSLTPEEAYTQGYLERPNRLEKFPWHRDSDMEQLPNLSPADALAFLTQRFAHQNNKFILSL
ncbi:hypothetical protein H6F90_04675 [Trichocoleus sp. FACHB-591]|uniref:hypothetical protein n=1 Tax=Trichocoleus sp. FACHB-591 TaxID=2692872 RepID=UPI0016890DF4|nr:hypothetical protein [Trichocoleus sp. FACHB-591]MBD2094445.1 hypothetical protein [Trichocoleus sp. FACHB-591]